MNRCTSVQERIADEGVDLVGRDAAIGEHVAGCSHCSAFVEALRRVDAGMSRLPPKAAPHSVVQRAARAVAGDGKTSTIPGHGDPGARNLAAALAAVVVLAAGFTLTESVQLELQSLNGLYDRQSSVVAQAIDESRPAVGLTAPAASRPTPLIVLPESLAEPEALAEPAPRSRDPFQPFEPNLEGSSSRAINSPPSAAIAPAPSRLAAESAFADQLSKEQKKRDRKSADKVRREIVADMAIGRDAGVAAAAPQFPSGRDQDQAAGLRGALQEYRRTAPRESEEGQSEASVDYFAPPKNALPGAKQPRANERDDVARRQLPAAPGKVGIVAAAKDKREQNAPGSVGGGLAQSARPRQVARRFLADQEKLTGLSFQSDSGYWANTYVPGDPAIRLLEARLQRWDRSVLRASLGDARLESEARQNWQPFDLPENAALTTYLHADKRAVNGRSRLRVQVGIQASQKRSGLRPDMNVGVVLDLRRPLDDATGAKLRALVMALTEARQPGDRFSLTVAGHPGGLLVAPEAFRHGPIRVALQSLFTAGGEQPAAAMDLLAALHSASQSVRQGDDASAPLGASLVLLVSTAPIAEQRESLEQMAHENAVAGIGLSVVAVGGGTDLASIDRLVLLGQGHRRVLNAAEDAGKLVDRELHAASRAVARAVRLRIRLAPGVELIDILGSTNLSEQAAQRVRNAERSIDQRVARNTGIRADRGDDEEGIQIVIPSFFAGDSHAVLLDVVVPGPGPVADVSMRYKDLVYRRNGVARARLAIEDGHTGAGPLEHNVLKNQLAHVLARSAAAAGKQLEAGDHRGAVRTLTAARELITGMREEIPGWDNDIELRADETLLAQYLTALGAQFARSGQHQDRLADSLRYLAFRRLTPPHE